MRLTEAKDYALAVLAGPKFRTDMVDVALLRACGVRDNTLKALVRAGLAKHQPKRNGIGPKFWERYAATAKGIRALQDRINADPPK